MKTKRILGIVLIIFLSLSGRTAVARSLEAGMVSFTFDDGVRSVLLARDVLGQYGFPATFYLVGSYVGDETHITWWEAQSLSWDYGWEAGNHCWTHKDLTTMSTADMAKNIWDGQKALERNGLFTRGAFNPPFGAFNGNVIMNALGTATSLRQAWIETVYYNTPANIQPWAINVIPVKRDTSFTSLKTKIDQAAAYRYWIVFVIHDIVDAPVSGISDYHAISKSMLEQIVQYVYTKKLPVVNLTYGVQKLLYYKTLQ